MIEISRALYEPQDIPFHVSFILRGSRVVAVGFNRACTHPLNLKNKKRGRDGQWLDSKLMCSELSAFLKLRNKTDIRPHKCSLVNVRINRNLQIAFSRPCESCRSLITFLDFKEVWHTQDDGAFARMI